MNFIMRLLRYFGLIGYSNDLANRPQQITTLIQDESDIHAEGHQFLSQMDDDIIEVEYGAAVPVRLDTPILMRLEQLRPNGSVIYTPHPITGSLHMIHDRKNIGGFCHWCHLSELHGLLATCFRCHNSFCLLHYRIWEENNQPVCLRCRHQLLLTRDNWHIEDQRNNE